MKRILLRNFKATLLLRMLFCSFALVWNSVKSVTLTRVGMERIVARLKRMVDGIKRKTYAKDCEANA
jgi:hypothetical protein